MAESVKFGTDMVIVILKHKKKGGSVFGAIFRFYRSIGLILRLYMVIKKKMFQIGQCVKGEWYAHCDDLCLNAFLARF